ncbi:MAG: glycoside hydrolase family 16 protein [Spirochaetaceae bacterium]|jgi:beta-glucanase (GH16 family)|nr:glycoside hydrolase family 16 protein [Spirochaetaceae bacterium]
MKELFMRLMVFSIGLLLFTACSEPELTTLPDESDPIWDKNNWSLIWADEFDASGSPDDSIWTHEIWTPWENFNNEDQAYVNNRTNSRVEDGRLIMQATLTDNGGYDSSKLYTRGKESWTYGRIEIMAKIPSGQGSWPAIWMMPEDIMGYGGGWPDSGEIDIMEHVGYDQNNIHATIHTNAYNHMSNTQRGDNLIVNDCSTAFHLYAVDWYPDRLEFFIDDTKIFTFINERTGWQTWPYDKPFYLILNIAVGGSWGSAGGATDNSSFPWTMEVDYVRYYGPEGALN